MMEDYLFWITLPDNPSLVLTDSIDKLDHHLVLCWNLMALSILEMDQVNLISPVDQELLDSSHLMFLN